MSRGSCPFRSLSISRAERDLKLTLKQARIRRWWQGGSPIDRRHYGIPYRLIAIAGAQLHVGDLTSGHLRHIQLTYDTGAGGRGSQPRALDTRLQLCLPAGQRPARAHGVGMLLRGEAALQVRLALGQLLRLLGLALVVLELLLRLLLGLALRFRLLLGLPLLLFRLAFLLGGQLVGLLLRLLLGLLLGLLLLLLLLGALRELLGRWLRRSGVLYRRRGLRLRRWRSGRRGRSGRGGLGNRRRRALHRLRIDHRRLDRQRRGHRLGLLVVGPPSEDQRTRQRSVQHHGERDRHPSIALALRR